MSRQEPLIFIVSGEASGDNLAGRLMGALKEQTSGRARFAGVGGAQSAAQGLESLFPMQELSLMGLAEVIPHLPRIIKRLRQTTAAVKELKPDVVVTVDAPAFCLRLAHNLRGSGIPVVHYVAPQHWAWRPGRAKKLAKRVDHVMALLPFEVPFFAEYGVPCTYVGHSAIEAGAGRGDGKAFRERHGLPADAPVLGVVPGSRAGEVRRILPVFAEALNILKERYPNLHIVIPVAAAVAEEVEAETKDWPFPVVRVTDPQERFDAFAACDAAMSKSGTVTLELALAEVPMVVAYRVSPATAFLVKRMGVNVEYASLANLLLGRRLIPELIQDDFTPQTLAEAMEALFTSDEAREEQREGFRQVIEILGKATPPPSARAAQVVLDIVRARSAS
jgi:lipid-A-disaccharide synthase